MIRQTYSPAPHLACVSLLSGACATSTTESDANKTLALSVSRSIAANTLGADADGLLAPAFVYHGPAGLGPRFDGEMTRAEYLGYMTALGAAFSGMTMDFTQIVAEGDLVAVHYANTFQHTGVFAGAPPSGRQIRMTGTFVRRVVDGLVVEEWDNPDVAGLFAQVDLAAPTRELVLDVSRSIMNNELAAKADQLLAPDFAYHGPGGVGPAGDGEMTRAEYIAFMTQLSGAFSEMQMVFDHVVVQGDKVGVHYTNTFKHTGMYNGVPPTGRTIVIHGTFVRQVAGGKVIAEWDNPDSGALMAQLGFSFVPPGG